MGDVMNNTKLILTITVCDLILLSCVSVRAMAQQAISYSPEQWPKRWSTAIRHEQDARYPVRHAEGNRYGKGRRVFSDENLFFNSPEEERYRNQPRQRNGWAGGSHRRDNEYRYRYRRYSPVASPCACSTEAYSGYSYVDNPYAYTYSRPYLTGYPAYTGYGLYGPDPLLGYPGVGYPSLPGSPLGYPYPGLTGVAPLGGPYPW